MHPTALPAPIADRLRARRGSLHLFDRLEGPRTALVVIDMQRSFLEPGAPSEVPTAREIVPAINRVAAALRGLGGVVAWCKATFERSGPGYWPLFFDYMVRPELADRILGGLVAGAPGHELWPELDVGGDDIVVAKSRYSAFFPGACDLPRELERRRIDTVLVAGTMTNVCCEASARDAMMAGYKVVMLSDANAARSDEEHVASLATIAQFFGDVRTADEAIGLLGAASPDRRG
jgi:ureidoacrylate peracid hydrolase